MTPPRGLVNILPRMAQRFQIWREIIGAEVELDAMGHAIGRQTVMLMIVRKGWGVHKANIAHQTAVVQPSL
jgi:hypothetical protein